MTLKFTVLAISLTAILTGCGSGPQPMATQEMQQSFDNAIVVKQIYDASGGDFDKVPEADKKKLIERFKNEDGAKKAFAAIKNGPNSGPPAAPSASQ